MFAQHLPAYGWQPIILTVHEKHYEEKFDWKLHDLLPKNQRIEKVNAFNITNPRLIGDIGLRAFFQLRKRALEILRKEKIDFVYIPIPSFYTALIGPYLYKKTGVKYGIDYIDPWVHQFPGSEKMFSRHWFSTQLAKILEPIAVKYASLITGVSEGYFEPVFDRNPHLKMQAIIATMPYGGEASDHEFVRKGKREKGQWTTVLIPEKKANTFQFIYAGAMLPKAIKPLEQIFDALSSLISSQLSQPFQQIEFHFIGTHGVVKPIAEQFGIFNKIVFEHPERIPYLDVLQNLDAADGVFIMGSTELHYTPSKVYQAILSEKPILAVLHHESPTVKVLNESGAGKCVLIREKNDLDTIGERFIQQLQDYLIWTKNFDPESINKKSLNRITSQSSTEKLAISLNHAIKVN